MVSEYKNDRSRLQDLVNNLEEYQKNIPEKITNKSDYKVSQNNSLNIMYVIFGLILLMIILIYGYKRGNI